MNEPPRSIGTVTLERVKQAAHEGGQSLFLAAAAFEGNSKAAKAVRGFCDLLRDLQVQTHSLAPADVLDAITSATDYVRKSSRCGRKKRRHPDEREEAAAGEDAPAEDEDSESDDEGSSRFKGAVEAVLALARQWRPAPVLPEAETPGVPTLWSLACAAWLKQPPPGRLTAEAAAVADLAERWSGRGRGALAAFVEDAALRSATEVDSSPEDKVLVSTIHRFKGGERDITFVARFNQGFMPVEASTGDLDEEGKWQSVPLAQGEPGYEEHAEEERRLAHVAFSRARRRLVITYVRGLYNATERRWVKKERSSILLPSEVEDRIVERPPTEAEASASRRGQTRTGLFGL